jgi:hypothetical protein
MTIPIWLLLFGCAQHAPPSDTTREPSSPQDIPQWGAPPPSPPPASSEALARQRAEEARRRAEQARQQSERQRRQQAESERIARIEAEQARRRAEQGYTQSFNEGETIKSFPWPPPKPSTFSLIQRKYLSIKSVNSKLAKVENMIRESLEATGYYDVSYYGIKSQPDAFVMATRLEQINEDATPKEGDERWIGAIESEKKFSLKKYLNQLFYAEQGTYRIIVFVVTTESFSFTKESVSAKRAQSWVSDGNVSLPKTLASKLFTEQHQVFALVYEFDKASDESAKETVNLRIPGKHQTRTHLESSGIWELITKESTSAL